MDLEGPEGSSLSYTPSPGTPRGLTSYAYLDPTTRCKHVLAEDTEECRKWSAASGVLAGTLTLELSSHLEQS